MTSNLPLVGRVDQLHFEAVTVPFLFNGSRRNLRVQDHYHLSYFTMPARTARGKDRLPSVMTQAKTWANRRRQSRGCEVFHQPRD